jgi:tetratricopeptide (TPR) repeat protein
MAPAIFNKRTSFLLIIAVLLILIIIFVSIVVASITFNKRPDWRNDRALVMAELKNHPDRGILYCYLGRISFKETRFNDAIKSLEGALGKNLSPANRAAVYNELGDCYIKKNKIGKAIDYYRKAAVATADNAIPLNSLGQVCFNQREFEKARQYFEMAAAGRPKSAEYTRNLANAYLMLDNTKKACEYWEKSLKINRDQPDVREFLSRYQ